jgi:hypothetical protein
MMAVHDLVPIWELLFLFLTSLWLSFAAGWMPEGPGCLHVHAPC